MTDPARMMYVTTGLDGGGAERLLATIVLQQPAAQIIVVSLQPGGVHRPLLQRAGIEVIDCGVRGWWSAGRAVTRLAALIRQHRPSTIYGWMYHGNLAALAARWFAGAPKAPLFWTVFCTDSVGPRRELRARIVRRMSAWGSTHVDGVVYNAEEAREYHRSIGFNEARSIVLTNVVNPEPFAQPVAAPVSLRAELKLSPETVVVVSVARVDPMKDWRTAQSAMANLPGVVTVAVGRGTDTLPRQDGFIGLGWRDDVARILREADIFMMSSAYGEGASVALTEAMLSALPCVVTNVGGHAGALGDAGVIVAPGDVAALRAAIADLAADPARRRALGAAARARAQSAMQQGGTLDRLQWHTTGVEF